MKLRIVVLYILILTMISFAQDIEKPAKKNFWLIGGIGVGNDSRLSAAASLSYRFGNKILSLRSAQCSTFDGTMAIFDLGVLYGFTDKSESFLASASAGISGVWEDGFYTNDDGFTVGIPVEVQFFLTPLPVIGVGLYGFGNLNPRRSYYGGCLCLQIGKLR